MYGLQIVSGQDLSPARAIDVIAVPGIGGDQENTWTPLQHYTWGFVEYFGRSSLCSRVSIYKYPLISDDAEIFSREGISRQAIRLLEAINGLKRKKRQKIVLIGHDIGGTLVKEALIQAAFGDFAFRDIYHSAFMLVFIGCPHIHGYWTNLDGSLSRLLYLNDKLTSLPVKAFIACLGAAIQAINADFLDVGSQLAAAIYNVSSDNEDLQQQVFLSHESEMQLTPAPIHFQQTSSLSHLDMARQMSAEARTFVEKYCHAPRWAELSKLRSSGSSLSYASSYRMDACAHPYELHVHQGANIQRWSSTRTTPFLAIQNVENFQFASGNILKFLLEVFDSSAFDGFLLYHFQFRPWDCRNNTVEAMLSTFLNQTFCDMTEETSSVCSSSLRSQSLGWSVDDLFKLYYHAILTRSDVDVVWILFGLDETVEFHSWLLEKLRTTATNCDLHFRVVFINSNAQELGLDAEYTTTVNWADPRTILEHESLQADKEGATETSANAIQKSLVSRSNEAGCFEGQGGDGTSGWPLNAAESEALQVIQRNSGLCRLTFLGSKLVTLFQRSDISYEHKKMVAIWLSKLQTDSMSTISKTRLLESLNSSLEVTFQMILDFAIPGPWSLESAIETLQLIALSFRPLTHQELGDLERARREWKAHYTLRPTDATAITSWLPGIIDLHDNEIHFSHPSFRRFLFSGNVEGLQLSEGELTQTHSRIARLCLEYLASSHGARLLRAAPTNVEDIAAPDPRMEFLSYAVRYWPKHAQLASTDFPLGDILFKRFITDKTLLDTWAELYWVRSSSALCPHLDRLGPFAICAEYGLEAILEALSDTHKDSEWLASQCLSAVVTAARNGMTNTVRLLFDLQSLDSEKLDLMLQASLLSGNHETISFVVSKALEIPNPSTCFSVALPQALAIGQGRAATRILSHLSWNNVDKERKNELLLAACTGGDTEAVDYVLELCKGEMCEDEIFEATMQACRCGHATASALLLSKLLVMKESKPDAKNDLTNDPHKASNGPEHQVEEPSTAHESGNADKDIFIHSSKSEQDQLAVPMTNMQKTPAQANTDSGSEALADEAPSGPEYGKIILQNAVNNGQYDVLQSVLEILNKHNAYMSLAEALLHTSIILRRPRCFRMLLQAFGQAHSPKQGGVVLNRNELLIEATSVGNISIIQDLLLSDTVLDNTNFPTVLAKALETSGASSEVMELVIDEGRKHVDEAVVAEELTRALAMAVEQNDERASKTLIQAGADVNKMSVGGTQTPLYHAAYRGNSKILEVLLGANADPKIPADDDDDGWSPIHAAFDNPDILKLLLAAGADFNVRSKKGHTPLYLASKWGYQKSVAEILKYQPDLNSMIGNTTVLLDAIEYNHAEIAIMLLDAGTDPCHAVTKGANALLLHRCVARKQVDLLRKLLLYNFDIEYRDNSGKTALNTLGSAEDIPALRLLIRRGAQVDTANNWDYTPLAKAVRFGDVELAGFLVSQGANVNQSIGPSGTPLLLACQSASLEMVKMLIEEGGDIKYVDKGMNGTIFQAACQNKTDSKPDLLSYLLENEMVDVQQTSSWWGSNLNTACLMADPDIIDLLVQRGADVNAEDTVGRRPIHFALYRTLEHVKRLRERDGGAELLVTDVMQRNALHCAVVSGRLDVVKYVLDEQPDLAKEKDCDGWTPLFWAVRECFMWDTETSERAAIIEILKKNGADIMDTGEGLDRIWTPFKLARYYGLENEILELVTPTKKQIATSNYKIFWEESINTPARVARRRENAFCDICLLGIVGIFYTCTECPTFALCFKCYRSRDVVHQKHRFTANSEDEEYASDKAVSSRSSTSYASSIDRSRFGGGDEEIEEEAVEDEEDDDSDNARSEC